MNLIRFLDEIDQRRGFDMPEQRRTCASCGEHGEFDTLHVVYPQWHHIAIERQFGGACCMSCLDEWAPCDNCGNLTDEADRDTGYCPECQRAEDYGRQGPIRGDA